MLGEPEHDVLSPATFSWALHGGVLTVTLNRPDRLNAINHRNRGELARFWAHWRRDAGLRCIVLTGAGRAFCAGADMHDLVDQAQPSAEIGAALSLPARPDGGGTNHRRRQWPVRRRWPVFRG